VLDYCAEVYYYIVIATVKQQIMSIRYTVWETNADLEEVRNYYIGDNRDVAETLACRLFVKAFCEKDFMITARNGSDTEIHGMLFSDLTKARRNECQG